MHSVVKVKDQPADAGVGTGTGYFSGTTTLILGGKKGVERSGANDQILVEPLKRGRLPIANGCATSHTHSLKTGLSCQLKLHVYDEKVELHVFFGIFPRLPHQPLSLLKHGDKVRSWESFEITRHDKT
jgi:hypothetical protein